MPSGSTSRCASLLHARAHARIHAPRTQVNAPPPLIPCSTCWAVLQELKAYNKNTKAEVEQARVQERAPIISPFAPTLQAQQLPHLRLVRMMYWVAKKRDAGCERVGEHVNPKLPPAVRGGMEPSYGWLMKTRLSFFNTVVSLLCGNGVAAPVPVGRAKLPTVRGDAVVFERAVPQVVRGAGGAMPAAGQPARGGGQVRMPNRCRHCGCAKCDPHNKSCTTEQRLAWCTRNGWLRHWSADDGMMNNNGPRPIKSKLPRCVRCETDGAGCLGPSAEI